MKNQKAELIKKISDTEKMIEEIPQYLEILNRRPLMPNDIKELSRFTHLKDVGVISFDDAERLNEKIACISGGAAENSYIREKGSFRFLYCL